jgi:hypothetical protein
MAQGDTDLGTVGKPVWILLGAVVLGGGWWFWHSMGAQEEAMATQHVELSHTWGAGALTICSARLPEQPAPVPPDRKLIFVGPRSATGGPVEVAHVELPSAMRASSSSNLTHVACVAYAARAVADCSYERGYVMRRIRYDATVRLVDLRARAVIGSWKAEGPEPECPRSIKRQQSGGVVNGGEPDYVNGLFTLPGMGRGPSPRP